MMKQRRSDLIVAPFASREHASPPAPLAEVHREEQKQNNPRVQRELKVFPQWAVQGSTLCPPACHFGHDACGNSRKHGEKYTFSTYHTPPALASTSRFF